MNNTASVTACPLCRGKENAPFIRGFDRLYAREEDFDYVKCESCGLVFQCPIPEQSRIESFYIEDYKPYQRADIARMQERSGSRVNRFIIRHFLGVKASRKLSFRRALAKVMAVFAMKDTLVPCKECRLLDVGCGNGGWIYKHHLLGWKAEGVEISDNASSRVREMGLTVHSGTLFDVPDDRVYDIISLRHVIEHVVNPVETLLRAKNLLAPGGKIILLLPNLNSYGFNRYGNCWYPLDPPRHLIQFTPRTIRLLGQKANLDLLSLRTQVQARMICVSRNYRRSFGGDFLSVRDFDERKRLVASNAASEVRTRSRQKLLRKILYLPSVVRAFCGRGETMEVVYTAKGDAAARRPK